MKVWVAVDIGCIECGEESRVIGIFKNEKAARFALIRPAEEQAANWHGQHSFEVFEADSPASQSSLSSARTREEASDEPE